MLARFIAIVKTDPTWLELISTTFMLIWGTLLVLPFETFHTSPSYAAMGALVNERVWGAIALFFSCLGFFGLFKDHKETRQFILQVGQFFWATIGACVLLANPYATGGWVYLALSIACGFAYLLKRRVT